jgi:hypothetical protein
MIQYIAKPYIISLEEIAIGASNDKEEEKEEEESSATTMKTTSTLSENKQAVDREFIATRLNFIGSEVKNRFRLSEVAPMTSKIHPFATFMVKDTPYFVFGSMIKDDELRMKLDGSKL